MMGKINGKKRLKLSKFSKVGITLIASILVFVSAILYVTAASPAKLILTVKDPAVAGTADKNPVVDYDENGTYITYDMNLEIAQEYNIVSFDIQYDKTKLEVNKRGVAKVIDFTASTELSDNGFSAYANETENGLNISVFNPYVYGTSNLNIGTVKFKVLDGVSKDVNVSITNISVQRGDFNDETRRDDIATDPEAEGAFINVPVNPASINLATPKLQINLGDPDPTEQIIIDYSPSFTSDDTNFTYNIKSGSAIDVVEIQNGGKIKALKTGNTIVETHAFGNTYEVEIEVVNYLSSVSLDKHEVNITRNEAVTSGVKLNATKSPTDATNVKTERFTSSDSTKASVDSTGKVTFTNDAKGQYTITYEVEAELADGTRKTYSDQAVINVSVPAESIKITDASNNDVTGKQTLTYGVDTTFKAVVTPADTTSEINWSSSDPTIATVTNGVVTPISGGEADITVTAGDQTATIRVEIIIVAEKIEFENNDEIVLVEGQTYTLIPIITPSTASNRNNINWSSNDSATASVANGVVTAKSAGTATITAAVDSVSTTKTIRVVSPVTGITIQEQNVSLYTNDSTQPKETQLHVQTGSAGEQGTVTWSSNSDHVTVDASGKITAVSSERGSVGTAVITATWTSSQRPDITYTATTTVNVHTNLESITATPATINLSGANSTATITGTMNPAINSEANKITYTSSNNNIATVDENGVVTAKNAGQAIITASAGAKTASVTVNVTIPAESVQILNGGTEITSLNMDINDIANLTAKVLPTNTSDTTVTWTSGDSSIITVANGRVTAVGAGSTTLTAKAGSVSKTINVTVIIPVNSFTLADGNTTGTIDDLVKGTTATIATQVTPSNATYQTITWESSKPSVATVDANGVVKGISQGSTTITGTLPDGKQISVTVSVIIIPITNITAAEAEVEVKKGQPSKIILDFEPANTTEKDTVVWESSDPTIATVDSNGNVTGLKEGTVTIKASVGSLEAEVEVTVKEIHIESFTVMADKSTIDIDESVKLMFAINPSDYTDDEIFTYKSSDTSVATVNEFGVITGVGKGTATITVTHENGVEATYEINVTGNKISDGKDESTDSENVNNNGKGPKTGDKSIGYIVLSLIALVGGVVSVLKFKKN